MPFNLNISDSFNFDGTQGTASNNQSMSGFAGVGSYITVPFMAFENQTINRLYFQYGTVTGAAGLSIMAGIGTWDNKLPSTVGGLGDSLNFLSQTLISSFVSAGTNFVSIPDITLEQGKRYYLGLQTISRGASSALAYVIYPFSDTFDEFGNYAMVRKQSAGVVREFSANHSCFNWGYYSGSGSTVWYNQMFGGQASTNGDQTRFTLNTAAGQPQFGMSIYINWNADAVEVEEFGFVVRTAKGGVASYGIGVTYNVILYDSDGTTALTASTQSYMSPFTSLNYLYMPLKYILKTKKEYFIAFNRESTNATTDYIVACGYPSQIMAGNSVTTYTFTKTSPSSSPVKNPGDMLIYDLPISKVYGSRQGSSGDIFRKYDPSSGGYI